MNLVVQTAPAEEPITLTEAKTHLRVDHSDDDALIGSQIVAARQWAETFTRRAFVSRTYDLYFDNWPNFPLLLPHPPLVSVTGIWYTNDSAVETQYSSSNYLVTTNSEPGRIVLKTTATLPSATLQVADGVRVRFVAGYGDEADVPAAVKAALLLLVGDLYENRENTVIGAGNSIVEVPFSVKNLLWPYRIDW